MPKAMAPATIRKRTTGHPGCIAAFGGTDYTDRIVLCNIRIVARMHQYVGPGIKSNPILWKELEHNVKFGSQE